MSDTIDDYKAMKAYGQARNAERRALAPDLLLAAGIDIQTANDWAHTICRYGNHTVDFWPGTGRWKFRASDRIGFGIDKLIAEIKK